MRKVLFVLFASFAILSSLKAQQNEVPADVETIYAEVKNQFAPDARVEMFKLTFTVAEKTIMICGQSTTPAAVTTFKKKLEEKGYKVVDCIKLLPDAADLNNQTWGIVKNSVCNIRYAADYAAENVTQGQMGMPVRIIQKNKWLQVQTPDGYLGWVENAAIQRVTKAEAEAWNGCKQLVVTALWAQVFSQPNEKSQVMGDIVAGNRMKNLGSKGKFYKVGYPDGRVGYISKTVAMDLGQWRKSLDNSPESILNTARRLIGIPYIWAGLSPKGADCSGFVRTTLWMHDIIIPRDASQMCFTGERVEIGDFSNLLPGDLLFFGSRNKETGKERVSHVGFYIGNKQFIHSLGNVHENSFDPQSPVYDEYNLGRLLFAAHVLPFINKQKGLTTSATNSFYSTQLP